MTPSPQQPRHDDCMACGTHDPNCNISLHYKAMRNRDFMPDIPFVHTCSSKQDENGGGEGKDCACKKAGEKCCMACEVIGTCGHGVGGVGTIGASTPPSSEPKEVQTTEQWEFMECDTCRAKAGTPVLCRGCLHNRDIISRLVKRF